MRQGDATLRPASVVGVGAVTPVGRGLAEIARGLGEAAGSSQGVLRVSDGSLACPEVGARLRRADRFVRMATVAALDAWGDAQRAGGEVALEDVGLILASGLGTHVRAFRFLDGILDFGDGAALPTDFSHSLHGTATSYITELLALRGPSLTMTDFENGVARALLLAQVWLARGRCKRVLVGAVEEVGEVMLHCAGKLAGDARLVAGEGAVFFVLGAEDVGGMARLEAGAEVERVDLLMRNDPPLRAGVPDGLVPASRYTTTFSPWFGHSAGSTAFQLLGGLLALQAGRPLERILRDSGAGGRAGGAEAAIDSAAAFMPSSMPDARLVVLTRSGG